MTSVAYCPHCGSPIGPIATDIEGNITWDKCPGRYCRMRFKIVTTDKKGFILSPEQYKDGYIYARNWKKTLENR